MFLSQLLVNTGSDPDKPCPGLEWIKQTYRVHQRIWMAFPDDQRRTEDPFFLGTWTMANEPKPQRKAAGFLFRVEPDRPTRVLVQSVLKPDWEYAFQNARHLLAAKPAVREFEPEFINGQAYCFRLVMLMVKRRTGPAGEAPKSRSEHPIRCLLPPTVEGEKPRPDPTFTAWRERLAQEAAKHGFTLGEYPTHLSVQPTSHLLMKPKADGRPERFNAACFDGLLTCTDATALRAAAVNGIGRGKAFGMGLLSLATSR